MRAKPPFAKFRAETAERSSENQRDGILAFDSEDVFSQNISKRDTSDRLTV
jgi:hypothetical protein